MAKKLEADWRKEVESVYEDEIKEVQEEFLTENENRDKLGSDDNKYNKGEDETNKKS